MRQQLTGRHVLVITVAAFSVVIGANITMLMAAKGSFPGLVVKNSYVASQEWNGRTDAQAALGWRATVAWRDGMLTVDLADDRGDPVPNLTLKATVGRPTDARSDRTLHLTDQDGAYRTPLTLGAGVWLIDLRTVDGPDFRQQVVLRSAEPG